MTFTTFLMFALPVLTSAVPELVKLIKSDSKAAEKNATIAAKAFEIAQAALGVTNAQDVAERVQADPAAAQMVREAVREQWFSLSELTQLHDAVAAAIVLASYGIVTLVLIRDGFSDETRALLLGQVVILGFGTVVSFMFGSNLSNRVDQAQRQRQ